jgi:hypothetical protein
MTHNNRGRLTVDLGGNWRWYANIIPVGSKCIGTVTTAHGETGALVFTGSGIYARLNAGALVALPQVKVQAAVTAARAGTHGGPGRGQGVTAADGATSLRRVNVTLDDGSIAALRAFGDGELSLGIRRAAAHLKSL